MYALPHYDKGDWNCICDVCGRQFKASQLQLRWDGVMVCESDFEPRQPQDFINIKETDPRLPAWLNTVLFADGKY